MEQMKKRRKRRRWNRAALVRIFLIILIIISIIVIRNQLYQRKVMRLNNNASEAFASQMYEQAADYYIELADTYSGKDKKVELPEALCCAGASYEKMGDLKKARDYYEQAEERKYRRSYLYLSRLASVEEDMTAAYYYLQMYMDQVQDDPYAYYLYGQLALKQQDYNAALSWTEKAASFKQEDLMEACAYAEIVCYEGLLDYQTAYEKAAEFVKNYPDNVKGAEEFEFLKTRI
ncbi:MAG: tetratricopeptide repeat protein [Lachnospiraceae bacterium]